MNQSTMSGKTIGVAVMVELLLITIWIVFLEFIKKQQHPEEVLDLSSSSRQVYEQPELSGNRCLLQAVHSNPQSNRILIGSRLA